MKNNTRLEISQQDMQVLDPTVWKITHNLKEEYIFKLIIEANKLGLEGKKINEIVACEDIESLSLFIDFICEGDYSEK